MNQMAKCFTSTLAWSHTLLLTTLRRYKSRILIMVPQRQTRQQRRRESRRSNWQKRRQRKQKQQQPRQQKLKLHSNRRAVGEASLIDRGKGRGELVGRLGARSTTNYEMCNV